MNGMNDECPRFIGKYRGVVTDNKDPRGLGRIRAKVQDVFGGEESGWAMPCLPYAGKDVGLYLIPPEKAFVWIEFEHGDPDYPIWTGCFWAEGEVPVKSDKNETMPEKKVLKTEIATITLNDSSSEGGITIETNKGPKMKIVLNNDGIEINNGKNATIKLNNNKVSINGTALEVE
ncbi:MAG TPA: phage baseplate assembly protein V [Patescibacteria group bacterium]|nr:phage baseplate assembly protein V [Patescibacteria group bacterium]